MNTICTNLTEMFLVRPYGGVEEVMLVHRLPNQLQIYMRKPPRYQNTLESDASKCKNLINSNSVDNKALLIPRC